MRVLYLSVLTLAVFLALAAAAFIISGYGFLSKEQKGKVLLKDREFNVEIARSTMARNRGLSGRESLGEKEGMLFLFSGSGFHSFWMKGMRIPIDIIWIKDDRVAGFEINAQPEPGVRTAKLKRYLPPEPVDRVLEVPAGTVERLDIQVGDEVKVSYN